jgi:hypothetical protein
MFIVHGRRVENIIVSFLKDKLLTTTNSTIKEDHTFNFPFHTTIIKINNMHKVNLVWLLFLFCFAKVSPIY